MMCSEALPRLGVGIGYREPYLSDLFLHRSDVDFLEIVADTFLEPTLEQEKELDLLARHFTLIPHAVNLSLGSADGVDETYLKKLGALVERVQAPWWSEHISFSRSGGVDVGHLSPVPFSREAVDVFRRNIADVRRVIDTPLILENISYTVALPFNEMDEASFVRAIVETTDCGMLLDITNLYTNAVNHGYDAVAFLDAMPLERVVQLHFAGGHWHDGVLVDSHSRVTPPAVWTLMEDVLSRVKVNGVVLERDENLPAFTDIVTELDRVRPWF